MILFSKMRGTFRGLAFRHWALAIIFMGVIALGLADALLSTPEEVRAVTGASWQLAWKATGTLYDLKALNDDVIVGVGSEGMVVKSTDGGESWAYLALDPNFDLFAVDFVNKMQGLAVGTGGVVFRTEDGGESWLPGDTGARVDLHGLQMIDAQHGWAVGNQGVVVYTDNGGLTWQPLNTGVHTNLYDVFFIDANKGWIVGDSGTILYTTDGGKSWQHQPVPVHTDLRGIFFMDGYRGWAVGSEGVILSTVNGGGIWQAETDTGYPKSTFWDVDCGGGVCYVVGDHGATLRYDGSWTRYYGLNSDQRILYAVDARDGRRAWTGGTRHTEDVEFTTSTLEYDVWGVFYTRDGGGYWRVQIGDLFPRFRKLHFINDQEGYVVGGDWSYRRTTDGGKTWTQFQSVPPDRPEHQFYYDIDCLDINSCYIVGRYGTVRLTRNGGTTWQDQTIIDSTTGIGRGYGKFLYAVVFRDEENAFAGGNHRLFFTDDALHWRRAHPASGDVFDIELLGATDGMATTSTVYYLRLDANGHWSQRNTAQNNVKLYGLDILDEDGDGRLDRAWMVGCVSSRCDDEAAIIFTDNSGATWQRAVELPDAPKLSDISMVDAQMGWAVGDHGAILITTDGGYTWTRQFSPATGHLESVQALGPDRAFASGWDGVILRYGPSPLAFSARPQSYLAAIDGYLDEWGHDVVMHVNALLAYHTESSDEHPPSLEDISANVRMRWQEDTLFLAIDVWDDDVSEDDSISVALDGLNDNLWGDDDLDFTLYPDGEVDSEAEGLTAAATMNDHGYQVEVAIPAVLLGNRLAVGRSVGLNIELEDEDGDGSSARLVWSAPTLADDPDRFADIRLLPFDDQRRIWKAFAASGQVVDGDLSDWDDLGLITLDWDLADSHYGPHTNARAQMQLQWQPQGLLGAIRVQDGDVSSEDNVIFALDGDNDGRHASPEDIVVTFNPEGALSSVPDMVSFTTRTADGYAIEFFIPTHVLGGSLEHGRLMGVNVSLMDASPGMDSSLLVWEGATPAENFGDFGQLFISDRILVLQMGRDGFMGVEDTNLDSYYPTENFAAAPVHRWKGSPSKSSLIRFDLTSFPEHATATGGTLAFRVLTDDDEDIVASVYAMARDWDVNEASWAYAQPGIRWQKAGAQGPEDRIEPATDVRPLTGPGWIRFDVGSDLRAILNEGAANRGWLIEPTGGFGEFQVAASEYPTPEDRPALTIRYVLPVSEQPTATPTPTPTPTLTPTPTSTPTPTPIPFYLPLILRTYEIPPILLPDLVPLDMTITTEEPMICTDAEHPAVLGVRARFANQGTAAAGAFVLTVNGVRKDAPPLDAGQEASVWLPGFAIGINSLVLDVDDQVMEMQEGNNELAQNLPLPTPLPTCTPAP